MKAAIYARVSDDKKKEDGSRRQDVNRQLEMLRAYLERASVSGWEEYVDDGKSAFTEDLNQRPAFKKLLRDARAHWIDHIYVESLDRFSRKMTMGMRWLESLGKSGCTVTSLKEGEIDVTSDEGWLRSGIFLLMAEWYSRSLSSRVKSGMKRAKEKGNKHIGRPRKKASSGKGG